MTGQASPQPTAQMPSRDRSTWLPPHSTSYGEDSYRRIFRSNEPDGVGAASERAARVSA